MEPNQNKEQLPDQEEKTEQAPGVADTETETLTKQEGEAEEEKKEDAEETAVV